MDRKRNLEEYLRLISIDKLNLNDLIEKEYPIKKANDAFREIQLKSYKPLIVLLKYNFDSFDYQKEIILNRKNQIK